ncbi:MAG: hypothetical protein ACC682_14220 [Gemmatimonadota bacterium]
MTLDDRVVREIAPSGKVTFSDLEVGEHKVVIGDVALNCPQLDETSRVVDVPANGTVTVLFEVECSNLVYVAQNWGGVAVLESVNDSVVLLIDLPGITGADDIAVSPDGKRLYVVERIPGRLVVLETERYTPIANIDLGGFARSVAVSPDGGLALVSVGRTVVFVEAASNTVRSVTHVGRPPEIMTLLEFAFSPDGSTAYVTDFGPVDAAGRVWALDVGTGSVLSAVSVGEAPHGVGGTPDGTLLFVGDQNSEMLTVLKAADLTVSARIRVDRGPHSITVSPDGSLAYVSNLWGRVGERGGTISVIDIASSSVLSSIRVPQSPSRTARSPDGDRLYVIQTGGQLGVVDTESRTLVKTIMLPGSVGVAIPPSRD